MDGTRGGAAGGLCSCRASNAWRPRAVEVHVSQVGYCGVHWMVRLRVQTLAVWLSLRGGARPQAVLASKGSDLTCPFGSPFRSTFGFRAVSCHRTTLSRLDGTFAYKLYGLRGREEPFCDFLSNVRHFFAYVLTDLLRHATREFQFFCV